MYDSRLLRTALSLEFHASNEYGYLLNVRCADWIIAKQTKSETSGIVG